MAEKILVVGSNPIDQQSLSWSLLEADYQVRYARSTSNAIKIITTETPCAVLLSLEPDQALAICFLIRRVDPAIPLLVIGPEDDTSIKVALLRADADDYVLKPFDSTELVARIRSAVRRSKKELFRPGS